MPKSQQKALRGSSFQNSTGGNAPGVSWNLSKLLGISGTIIPSNFQGPLFVGLAVIRNYVIFTPKNVTP